MIKEKIRVSESRIFDPRLDSIDTIRPQDERGETDHDKETAIAAYSEPFDEVSRRLKPADGMIEQFRGGIFTTTSKVPRWLSSFTQGSSSPHFHFPLLIAVGSAQSNSLDHEISERSAAIIGMADVTS